MPNSGENNKKYVVTHPTKVTSEYGYHPSLLRYLASRILIPVVLTPVLALIKGGIFFIIIMWVFIIAKNVMNYYEMYPKTRLATPEEIEAYKESQEREKKKELVCLKTKYDFHVKYHDEYGWTKGADEEYSYKYKDLMKTFNGVLPSYYEDMRNEEMEKRAEMEKKLSEAEEEYGSNWYEELRRELNI